MSEWVDHDMSETVMSVNGLCLDIDGVKIPCLKLACFHSVQSLSVFKSNCSVDIPTNNPACLDGNNMSLTLEGGNGPTTGNCIPVEDDDRGGGGRCEIYAWCDTEVENDTIRYA